MLKRKVFKIANEYSRRITQYDNMEAIILGEAADIEVYDPNFIIAMDVYYSGRLLSAKKRNVLYGNPEFFESSSVYPMDRFISENLPVIINYRHINRIDRIFDRIERSEWVFRMESSNIFHRLKEGHVLFNRNGWIDKIKKRFTAIPDEFWEHILDSARFLIEHHLREINVSIFKSNNLLYLISLTHFIKSVCSFIYALNKDFEPSPRLLYGAIKKLPNLPDEFMNRFNILLNPATEVSLEQKGEVATLITKSLITMKLE
ncbi:MAG: DUF4037 domain-containing protein [Spirochaetales bacterium]|nr:DUF4037 domain-containing protein [Spirochaetales bacterium]